MTLGLLLFSLLAYDDASFDTVATGEPALDPSGLVMSGLPTDVFCGPPGPVCCLAIPQVLPSWPLDPSSPR